jgi:hypothetical protein
MFVVPLSIWTAAFPATTLGTEPRAARALPQLVRRPQPLAEPNPMRAANPRRAARSRSRVPTPPPFSSHPRVAPLDRASQVAVLAVTRDGLSASPMVRGPVRSVNRGQEFRLLRMVRVARFRVPSASCRPRVLTCASSAFLGALAAASGGSGVRRPHRHRPEWHPRRRHRSPETGHVTNASR